MYQGATDGGANLTELRGDEGFREKKTSSGNGRGEKGNSGQNKESQTVHVYSWGAVIKSHKPREQVTKRATCWREKNY